MMNRRAVVLLIVALVAVVMLAWRVVAGSNAPLNAGVRFTSPQQVEDFTLTDSAGQPRAFSTLQGQYVALFFGYTNCPDVCPATLSELKKTMPLLGTRADRLQVVMITVDPEHDTPQTLQRYLSAFDPRFIGLTGEREQIERIATRFGIYCEPMESDSVDEAPTTIDHTASILIIDPGGHLLAMFPGSTRAEPLAADLQALLR